MYIIDFYWKINNNIIIISFKFLKEEKRILKYLNKYVCKNKIMLLNIKKKLLISLVILVGGPIFLVGFLYIFMAILVLLGVGDPWYDLGLLILYSLPFASIISIIICIKLAKIVIKTNKFKSTKIYLLSKKWDKFIIGIIIFFFLILLSYLSSLVL